MRLLLLLLLGFVSACQSDKPNSTAAVNASRDLLIDRVFWQPEQNQSQHTRVNQHKFAITNTSLQTGYRRITVRFDYYDQHYHWLDSAIYTVNQSIEPRSAIRIDSVQTGKANPATRSATVTVLRAESE
ncbi:hypothetical protein [Spirosoma oryzicola]|uniref:hypothetical protein n=1 Tax=Spirosoma oryzicola TaxID=2898794 RepID=UPI001E43EE80|nr:hypothetical protein [Spirosoma oryzicola]UHG92965.1 hypothetical protein LQ777_08695 [Spirosoma oryzicola]